MSTQATGEPDITLRIVRRGQRWLVEAENIGDKAAVDINLSPILLRHERRDDVTIKFAKVEFLPAEKAIVVGHMTWFGDAQDNGANDMLMHLKDQYARGEAYETELRYQDFQGRQYVEKVRLGFGSGL